MSRAGAGIFARMSILSPMVRGADSTPLNSRAKQSGQGTPVESRGLLLIRPAGPCRNRRNPKGRGKIAGFAKLGGGIKHDTYDRLEACPRAAAGLFEDAGDVGFHGFGLVGGEEAGFEVDGG
jgi:hypothetical protein